MACVGAVLAVAGCRQPPPSSGKATSVPTVSGPVTGGKVGIPFNSAPPEILDAAGYREDEYFVSGTAQSYRPQGQLGADGQWELQPAATADYRSRVLVRRPADPARFSGNVVVEWFNVSGGIDVDPDFGFLHPEILSSGDVFVGVSAQKVGIDGGASIVAGAAGQALKKWDPQRYGSLNHPGDPYSYDIFSQVGRELKQPGTSLLGGLRPTKVIAAGESQSAMRLFDYVDGVHPLAKAYDGFLVHSRMAGGGFGTSNVAAAKVRADLDVPVLQFVTETDLALFYGARQADTDKVRTWEVAGTAHADKALQDYQLAAMKRANGGKDLGDPLGCKDINDGPQRYVVRRAYADLKRWVGGGAAPARSPLLETTTGSTIARDDRGIARGGIRTPAVDVPVATLSGQSTATGLDALTCGLFGSTKPFDAATLRALYPTHDDYVAKVTGAADRAVGAGFLRSADAPEIVATARAAAVPPPAA